MEEATLPQESAQPSRWARYTPALQRAIYVAQERAAAAGLREIGPEHLLEGLLADADGLPAWLVSSHAVDLSPLQRGLHDLLEQERSSTEIRLSPTALHVLGLAEWEARELGDPGMGTGHVLLGLLDVQSEVTECLRRWRMTRLYLYEWLSERTPEEWLDRFPLDPHPQWPLDAGAVDPADEPAQAATPAHPLLSPLLCWLLVRALWGGFQAMALQNTPLTFALIPHSDWLLLWSIEGLWTAAGSFWCMLELMGDRRRGWTRTFAFLYVQCAVVTVAGMTASLHTPDPSLLGLRSALEFTLLTGVALAVSLYRRRTEFGVGEREGWRAMYREGGWVLAVGALLGAAGLLAWPLARGYW